MERCPPFPGVTQGAATLRAPLALPGVGDPSGLRVLGPTLLREAHLPPPVLRLRASPDYFYRAPGANSGLEPRCGRLRTREGVGCERVR